MKCKKCDRCGCTYTGNATRNVELAYRMETGGHTCYFYDLCDTCRKSLNDWFVEKVMVSRNVDVL